MGHFVCLVETLELHRVSPCIGEGLSGNSRETAISSIDPKTEHRFGGLNMRKINNSERSG